MFQFFLFFLKIDKIILNTLLNILLTFRSEEKTKKVNVKKDMANKEYLLSTQGIKELIKL